VVVAVVAVVGSPVFVTSVVGEGRSVRVVLSYVADAGGLLVVDRASMDECLVTEVLTDFEALSSAVDVVREEGVSEVRSPCPHAATLTSAAMQRARTVIVLTLFLSRPDLITCPPLVASAGSVWRRTTVMYQLYLDIWYKNRTHSVKETHQGCRNVQ
jgi:hypothetical protein